MPQPLRPPEAKALIRKLLAEGTVWPTKHALAEMAKDSMDMVDVTNVLRGGRVGERSVALPGSDAEGPVGRGRAGRGCGRAGRGDGLEGEAMKCRECRGEMTSTREAHRYAESGLPNVTLVDVEVRHCPSCGERTVGIPRVEELHRLLALELARKPERLLPNEIRFLRKYLGLSGVDFAERMRVDPATVSRWERAEEPQAMGAQAELLLRLMAVRDQPVSEYGDDELGTAARSEAAPLSIRLRVSRGGWRHDAAEAA